MVLDSELESSHFDTLFLWRSCAVPRVGTELATMLGLDPELGSIHFSMGSVGVEAARFQPWNRACRRVMVLGSELESMPS